MVTGLDVATFGFVTRALESFDVASRHGSGPTATLSPSESLSPRSDDEDAHLALVEQLGQSFEELHWLRLLATTLTTSGPTVDLTTIGATVLPTLQSLLRAEAVVLSIVPPADSPAAMSSAQVIAGQSPLDRLALGDLRREIERAGGQPLVFNRDSPLQTLRLQAAVRNLVAAPLDHGRDRYGWLVALNRLPPALTDTPLTDVRSPEFGTYEHGLLTTAAGMLAGHARNLELFRKEEQLRVSIIETLAEALDARDPYTCGHSRRVGKYASQIARRYGCTAEECERIYITGLLHDVGKIGIPDHILKKADKLTDEEFAVIQQHPTIGHTILLPLKGLSFVLPGVLHHHERMDGRGYPHGLSGGSIPLMARMLAVADSYDAMTSNRAYRHAMSIERALSILADGAGPQWDATLVEIWQTICREAEPTLQERA